MLQVKDFISTSIIYYNFLLTSNLVCHHHLLSLVIVFTRLLGSSLFVDVQEGTDH